MTVAATVKDANRLAVCLMDDGSIGTKAVVALLKTEKVPPKSKESKAGERDDVFML